MDVNDLRVAVTLVSLLVFLGLMAWVLRGRHTAAFEAAARIPFAENDGDEAAR